MRRTAADVGVEVVVPALAALLGDATLEVRGDPRPLLRERAHGQTSDQPITPHDTACAHSMANQMRNQRRRGWYLRAVSRNEFYDYLVLLRPPVALDHLRVKHLAPAVQTLDCSFVLEVRRNRLRMPRSAAIAPPISSVHWLD